MRYGSGPDSPGEGMDGCAGCAGIAVTEIVPTVTLSMVDPGNDAESLSRGRKTYLARCVGCHRALPVRDYSREQWERVLPGINVCILVQEMVERRQYNQSQKR